MAHGRRVWNGRDVRARAADSGVSAESVSRARNRWRPTVARSGRRRPALSQIHPEPRHREPGCARRYQGLELSHCGGRATSRPSSRSKN